MTSDADHAAVYAAELDAFDGTDLESPVTLPELQHLAARVVTMVWWPGPRVEVVAARRDARSSSARCVDGGLQTGGGAGGVVQLRIAAPQSTVATLAHELAHALAGPAAGHGPTYRAAYLDVVAAITNLDPTDRRRLLHVDQLRSAFLAHDLSVGSRGWAAPPDAGAIEL